MATTANNLRETEREQLSDNESDSAGWAVAVVIVIAVLALGGYLWSQYQGGAASQAPAGTGDTNIEISVPPTEGPTSDAGGAAGTSSFTGSLTDARTASTARNEGY